MMKKFIKRFFLVVGILIALFTLALLSDLSKPKPPMTDEDFIQKRKIEVIFSARELIKKNVKHPESLDFGKHHGSYLVKIESDSNIYSLKSSFKSNNDFGQSMTNLYEYKVRFVDSLRFVPLKFEIK